MASTFTPVTPLISEYITSMFNAEDPFLRELREEAAAAGIPAINISGAQGAFIQVLLRAMNAQYVLEIGSLAGYSAIIMARALPENGKVICIEINEEYAAFIRRKATEASLDHKIEVVCMSGTEFLQKYSMPITFDFVFIDADKPNYSTYCALASPHVRTGGIIAADNTLAWGEIANELTDFEPRNVHALQEYNKNISLNADYQSCLVPVGDGMTLAYKI